MQAAGLITRGSGWALRRPDSIPGNVESPGAAKRAQWRRSHQTRALPKEGRLAMLLLPRRDHRTQRLETPRVKMHKAMTTAAATPAHLMVKSQDLLQLPTHQVA